MHVPFSMSDEPDLGDEFKGSYENTCEFHTFDYHNEPVREKTYTETQVHEMIRGLIKKSLELRDEAYWEGFNEGLRR